VIEHFEDGKHVEIDAKKELTEEFINSDSGRKKT